MKYCFGTLIFVFITSLALGQGGVLEFNVSKPDLEIEITPNDSVFWTDKRNIFSVRKLSGKSEIARVFVTTGRVRRLRNNTYEASFDTIGKTVLKIIERKPNGKTQLFKAIPCEIKETPKPTITVCGVKQDSAIDLKRLLHIGTLEANYKNDDQITPAIMGFEMVNVVGGNEEVFAAQGNRISLQMKNAIRNMSEGRTLLFRNIQIKLPNGITYVHKELSVFVITTNEYNVGFREK